MGLLRYIMLLIGLFVAAVGAFVIVDLFLKVLFVVIGSQLAIAVTVDQIAHRTNG